MEYLPNRESLIRDLKEYWLDQSEILRELRDEYTDKAKKADETFVRMMILKNGHNYPTSEDAAYLPDRFIK